MTLAKPLHALVCSTSHAGRYIASVLASTSAWKVTQLTLSADRGAAYAEEVNRAGPPEVDFAPPNKPPTDADRTPALYVAVGAADPATAAAAAAADVIALAMPAFAHEPYLRAVLPHVRPGTAVLVLSAYAHTDLLIRSIWRKARPSTAGSSSAEKEEKEAPLRILLSRELPWLIRDSGAGRFGVRMLTARQRIMMCGLQVGGNGALRELPADDKALWDAPLRLLAATFTGTADIVSGGGAAQALSLALFNPNAMMHVCIQRAFAEFDDSPRRGRTSYSREEADALPPLYTGVTDQGAALLDGVSEEAVAVRDALLRSNPALEKALGGDAVQTYNAWVRKTYADRVPKGATTQIAISTNQGLKAVRHPMRERDDGRLEYNYDTRLITEDVPMGLLAIKGFAQLAGCDTPLLDDTLRWAGKILKTTFVNDDGSIGQEALSGSGRAVQLFGVDNVEDLVAIYDTVQ